MALCLRKVYTILLYLIMNKKILKLTMDIRLRTPCLWKGLELVRILSDGTYVLGLRTQQSQVTTNRFQQPKCM